MVLGEKNQEKPRLGGGKAGFRELEKEGECAFWRKEGLGEKGKSAVGKGRILAKAAQGMEGVFFGEKKDKEGGGYAAEKKGGGLLFEKRDHLEKVHGGGGGGGREQRGARKIGFGWRNSGRRGKLLSESMPGKSEDKGKLWMWRRGGRDGHSPSSEKAKTMPKKGSKRRRNALQWSGRKVMMGISLGRGGEVAIQKEQGGTDDRKKKNGTLF